jgi:hypothetical protein
LGFIIVISLIIDIYIGITIEETTVNNKVIKKQEAIDVEIEKR